MFACFVALLIGVSRLATPVGIRTSGGTHTCGPALYAIAHSYGAKEVHDGDAAFCRNQAVAAIDDGTVITVVAIFALIAANVLLGEDGPSFFERWRRRDSGANELPPEEAPVEHRQPSG